MLFNFYFFFCNLVVSRFKIIDCHWNDVLIILGYNNIIKSSLVKVWYKGQHVTMLVDGQLLGVVSLLKESCHSKHSKKQRNNKVVAKSSAKAEYKSMAHHICEMMWAKSLLKGFGVLCFQAYEVTFTTLQLIQYTRIEPNILKMLGNILHDLVHEKQMIICLSTYKQLEYVSVQGNWNLMFLRLWGYIYNLAVNPVERTKYIEDTRQFF